MIFDYLPQLARIDGIKYCCSAFFLVTAIVSSNWDSVSTLLLEGSYFLQGCGGAAKIEQLPISPFAKNGLPNSL